MRRQTPRNRSLLLGERFELLRPYLLLFLAFFTGAYGFTGLKFLSSFAISTAGRKTKTKADAGVASDPLKNAAAVIAKIVFFIG